MNTKFRNLTEEKIPFAMRSKMKPMACFLVSDLDSTYEVLQLFCGKEYSPK